MGHKQIVMDGIRDGLAWLVIAATVLLGIIAQAFKAAGIHPPLTAREILVRSGGAGVAAFIVGLLLLGLGKIELHWALYMGLGGVIGYWGQEALDWTVNKFKRQADQVLPGQGGDPK